VDLFEQLVSLVDSAREDAEKFYSKDNASAGTRVRKSMQDIKNHAQKIRLDVQEKKNA
jgi:hypothetical protein